jgi:predicted kinase
MLLFIGIQASGKSTFYREHFFDSHVRISLDLLNTRHRETSFLQACFSTQQRFVVDNTNPTREERARYIAAARQARFRVIGYFFEPDPAASQARNAQRDKRHYVPPAGLFGTLKRLERPVIEEGFDELYIVRASDGRFDVSRQA